MTGAMTHGALAGSSVALYDHLADDYDAHFSAPHRAAYDSLAWEFTVPLLPDPPGVVVDVGCGVGRWASQLVALGHHVIGIEPAPKMAAAARRRIGSNMTLLEARMEQADLAPRSADLVVAMGSLQYADDPESMIERLSGWLRPGGWIAILVDSRVALVHELFRAGRDGEAIERLRTRRGLWVHNDLSAQLHLFDSTGLRNILVGAGAVDIQIKGLLAGWTFHGREELLRRLDANWESQLDVERTFAHEPALVDLGKQLFVAARIP